MGLADDADEAVLEQRLDLDLGAGVAQHADVEIDRALAQRPYVLVGLGGEAQPHAWGCRRERAGEPAGEGFDEALAGADGEDAVEGGEVQGLGRQAPLVPLDLLRRPPFRISVIASVCCFAGQMASYVALPFYLQHNLGQNAFMTGLYMLLSAPRERSGAAGGMQATARLLGQTVSSVIMTLLFTLTAPAAAPRIGLAVGAVLCLAAGLVSVTRIERRVGK